MSLTDTSGFLRRADVIDGPLDHPLKADGLLQHVLIALGDGLHVFLEKGLQLDLQVFDVAAAVLDDVDALGVVQYGKQNVFNAHIFVATASWRRVRQILMLHSVLC